MTELLKEIAFTIVVLICFNLAVGGINGAPGPITPTIKWLMYVMAAIVAVVLILRIWGITI